MYVVQSFYVLERTTKSQKARYSLTCMPMYANVSADILLIFLIPYLLHHNTNKVTII